MDVNLPAKKSLTTNTELLQAKLNDSLKLLTAIKADLVNLQQYEQSAEFRDIEILIEESSTKLSKALAEMN